jgi:hypothetical protein
MIRTSKLHNKPSTGATLPASADRSIFIFVLPATQAKSLWGGASQATEAQIFFLIAHWNWQLVE